MPRIGVAQGNTGPGCQTVIPGADSETSNAKSGRRSGTMQNG
jgi:hypothetical protein